MNDPKNNLPAPIAERLEGFRRKLWRSKFAEALLAAAFGLLSAFLIVFAIERFFDTSAWFRVVLLIAGSSLLAVFAPHWLHRWLWRHRKPDQLAKLVRRSHPNFGDRLLGAVELANQDENQTSVSPHLRAAALRQISEESERRGTFDDALPKTRYKSWGIVVMALTLSAVGGFILAPDAGWNALKRWLIPLGDTERYTFTRHSPLPDRLVVPRGEPFSIDVSIDPTSRQVPTEASVAVGDDLPFAVPLSDNNFPFRFNGLLTSKVLRFKIGDAAPRLNVVPLDRPAMKSLTAQLAYPDYLGIPAENINLQDGLINIVEGSKLRITGQTTRDLSSATISALEGESADLPNLVINANQFRATHAIAPAPLPPPETENAFASAPEAHRRLAFNLQDSEGLSPKSPFILMLRTIPDAPPTVYFEGPSREISLLDDEFIDFRVIASDDFGVKGIGYDWAKIPDASALGDALSPPDGQSELGQGSSLARRLEAPGIFSPSALGLGPQTLRLRAWAEDFNPNRPRTFSDPIVVTIMDRSQHAEMLRLKFGQLMDGLEELSRKEEADHEENKRLDRLEPEEMREQNQIDRLKEQTEAEQRNIAGMEKLKDSADKLFRDALRNKDMESETMKDWSEMLQKLDELAEKDMPDVRDSLEKSADKDNNTAEQQDKKMQESVEKQAAVLEKMREAMRKANKVEQNMEAGTFVNRLRSAARATNSIAGLLRENVLRGMAKAGISSTAGIETEDLEKDAYAELLNSGKRQEQTRSELSDLQEDFGHFFRRTGKAVYDEIRAEMEASEITDAFDDIAREIRKNRPGKSTPQLLAWGTRLNEWADKLAPPKKGGGGGGGGGGQTEDSDVELMLRLLRFVQQTQDIQSQTRRVEKGKIEIHPNKPAPPNPAPIPAPPAPTQDPNPY